MGKAGLISIMMVLLSFSAPGISFASQDDSAGSDFSGIELTKGEKKALEDFIRVQGVELTDAEKKAKEESRIFGKKARPAVKATEPGKNFTSRSAKTAPIKKSRFYISGGYLQNDMSYREITKRTGNVLDEDTGSLKGFYAALGFKSGDYIDLLQGSPFIEGYFQRYDALITYKGAAGGEPLTFYDEHAEIQRFGAKFGAYREISKKAAAFGYLDIGRRIWYRGQNRIIDGALDYAEKYWWTYFGLGGGFSFEIFPRFWPGVEAEVMYAPSKFSHMHADLYEGGQFDLGMVLGADIKLPIKYYILKNLSIDITPYLTYWEINKSSTTEIDGDSYYEPYSRTRIYGLLAGLTYNF